MPIDETKNNEIHQRLFSLSNISDITSPNKREFQHLQAYIKINMDDINL
jgi:hypothetical protein